MFRVTFVYRSRPHLNNEVFEHGVTVNLVAVALFHGCMFTMGLLSNAPGQ